MAHQMQYVEHKGRDKRPEFDFLFGTIVAQVLTWKSLESIKFKLIVICQQKSNVGNTSWLDIIIFFSSYFHITKLIMLLDNKCCCI